MFKKCSKSFCTFYSQPPTKKVFWLELSSGYCNQTWLDSKGSNKAIPTVNTMILVGNSIINLFIHTNYLIK